MEWACFWELTGLEKAAIYGAAFVGSIFIVVGFILMFYKGSPLLLEIRVWFDTKLGKISAFLPFPFACILVGCLFITAGGWWFARSFPTHNLSFSYGPWTLADIKERVERESKVRVDLKGEAASFKVDKDFSGACATDLVASICGYYDPAKLQCEHRIRAVLRLSEAHRRTIPEPQAAGPIGLEGRHGGPQSPSWA